MADNIRGVALSDDETHLDLRPLMRLGAWGACAFVALAIAVFAGRSDTGERRAGMALASLTGAPTEQTLRSSGAELLARAEAERETRRTTEALRILAADRDRLANRVATLERNIEDLTGSIKRQPEPARQSEPARQGAPTPPPAPASAPAAVAAPSTTSTAAPPPVADAPMASRTNNPAPSALPQIAPSAQIAAPPPAAPPAAPIEMASVSPPPTVPPLAPALHVPRSSPIALIQSYATATSPVVTPPAPPAQPAANDAAGGSVTARTEFAIDLGTAGSVNGLRALWEKTRARQPAQLDGLRPLVSVRDGQRPGSTELRLVAGPLANASAAARLCAALVATGTHCQPAVFDGQRLALR